MNLYLLRHAKAEPHGTQYPNDSKRPLSAEGEKNMRHAAQGMAALGLSFDLIISSPYLRAQRSAEITATIVKPAKVWTSSHLAPESSPAKLIEEINDNFALLENILLAGHEPFLSALASLLLTGGPGLAIDFKKSALVKLSIKDLRASKCAVLEWMLTPRQLQELRK